jgi:ribosomal protein L22
VKRSQVVPFSSFSALKQHVGNSHHVCRNKAQPRPTRLLNIADINDIFSYLVQQQQQQKQVKGLEQEALVIKHIQVNQAPRQRRRTYRAHGRINPYMSSPCHIEIILAEENEAVKREVEAKKPKLNARQLAARARRA